MGTVPKAKIPCAFLHFYLSLCQAVKRWAQGIRYFRESLALSITNHIMIEKNLTKVSIDLILLFRYQLIPNAKNYEEAIA